MILKQFVLPGIGGKEEQQANEGQFQDYCLASWAFSHPSAGKGPPAIKQEWLLISYDACRDLIGEPIQDMSHGEDSMADRVSAYQLITAMSMLLCAPIVVEYTQNISCFSVCAITNAIVCLKRSMPSMPWQAGSNMQAHIWCSLAHLQWAYGCFCCPLPGALTKHRMHRHTS